MDPEKVTLSLVKYTIANCQIQCSALSEMYTVPTANVVSMTINNDYASGDIFPYFQVSIVLPDDILRYLKKEPTDIHIRLTIKKGYYSGISGTEVSKPKSVSTFINAKFYAFIDNQTRNLNDSEIEAYEKSNGLSYKNGDYNSLDITSFLLYKEEDINSVNTIINEVLSNVTLVDSLAFTLNQANINNVLLSPPQKYTSYDQFILEPIQTKYQLRRICDDYAMHKNGTLIYFGLERKYIIDYDSTCTAYAVNENKTTYLYYPGNVQKYASNNGCMKNTLEMFNFILLQSESCEFKDLSTAYSSAKTSAVNVIDNKTGNITTTSSDGTFTIRTSGEDNASALQKKIDSLKKTANLGFTACDLTMLEPNKKFTITIDNKNYKNYNGDYVLARSTTTFSKEGELFVPSTLCNFKS